MTFFQKLMRTLALKAAKSKNIKLDILFKNIQITF